MEFKNPEYNQNNDFDNDWNNPKPEKPHDPNDLTDPRNDPNSYYYDPYLNNYSTPIQPKKTPPNSDTHNLSLNNQPPQPEPDLDSKPAEPKTNPFKVSPEKLAESVGSAHDIEEQQANEPLDKSVTGKDTPSGAAPDNRADLGLPTSGGTPLPKETKDKFQPKLKDQTLDDVEIISAPEHVNYIGAESFKLGKTIYTKDNNPASHILDHEVKHVVDAKTGKDRAPGKIRRWAKNDNWVAEQAAREAERKRKAAEAEARRKAAAEDKRKEAERTARRDENARQHKENLRSGKAKPYEKADLSVLKAKAVRSKLYKPDPENPYPTPTADLEPALRMPMPSASKPEASSTPTKKPTGVSKQDSVSPFPAPLLSELMASPKLNSLEIPMFGGIGAAEPTIVAGPPKYYKGWDFQVVTKNQMRTMVELEVAALQQKYKIQDAQFFRYLVSMRMEQVQKKNAALKAASAVGGFDIAASLYNYDGVNPGGFGLKNQFQNPQNGRYGYNVSFDLPAAMYYNKIVGLEWAKWNQEKAEFAAATLQGQREAWEVINRYSTPLDKDQNQAKLDAVTRQQSHLQQQQASWRQHLATHQRMAATAPVERLNFNNQYVVSGNARPSHSAPQPQTVMPDQEPKGIFDPDYAKRFYDNVKKQGQQENNWLKMAGGTIGGGIATVYGGLTNLAERGAEASANLVVAGEREGGLGGATKQVAGYATGIVSSLGTKENLPATAITLGTLGVGAEIAAAAHAGKLGRASVPVLRTMQVGGAFSSGTSIGQGISGKNMFTGETLSTGDRALHSLFGVGGVVLDLAGAGLQLGKMSKNFPTLTSALEGVSAPKGMPLRQQGRSVSTETGAIRLGGNPSDVPKITKPKPEIQESQGPVAVPQPKATPKQSVTKSEPGITEGTKANKSESITPTAETSPNVSRFKPTDLGLELPHTVAPKSESVVSGGESTLPTAETNPYISKLKPADLGLELPNGTSVAPKPESIAPTAETNPHLSKLKPADLDLELSNPAIVPKSDLSIPKIKKPDGSTYKTDIVKTEVIAPKSEGDRFEPENFPTPELILRSNDPKSQALLAGFAKKMSAGANDFKAEFSDTLSKAKTPKERETLLEKAYQWWIQKRYGMLKPDEKILNDIQPGDPNRDPFGKIARLLEDGKPTPAYRTREEIGNLIKERFRGLGDDVEVLDNPVKLPKWVADELGLKSPDVLGNRLIRGKAADEIDLQRQPPAKPPEKQYGYDPGAEKFISETGDPKNQKILHDAGIKVFSRLLGQGATLRDPQSLKQFSEAAYFFFQGPIKNRGSDSVIRGYLSSMGELLLGKPITLPHDVDIQAYARSQEDFTKWLMKGLRRSESSSSGKISSANTQDPQKFQQDQKVNIDITDEKIGYVFGHATGRQHNIHRAEQNIVQMQRLGLSDTPENRNYVREHLESVPEDQANIVRDFQTEHGHFEIRESLISGPSGKFSLLESSWEIMPDGTRRLTSVIPKGGPKKSDR